MLPFLVLLRSPALNHQLHRVIYLFKVFLPVLLLYVAANLAVLPFAFLKLLLLVCRNQY